VIARPSIRNSVDQYVESTSAQTPKDRVTADTSLTDEVETGHSTKNIGPVALGRLLAPDIDPLLHGAIRTSLEDTDHFDFTVRTGFLLSRKELVGLSRGFTIVHRGAGVIVMLFLLLVYRMVRLNLDSLVFG
jgi:hypothetical protein